MTRITFPLTLFATAVAACVAVTQAVAGDLQASASDGVEVDRSATDLRDDLRPRDIDRDIADTALVFTNLGGHATRVLCAGFNGNGRVVGRAWLRVPPLGVRYMLASDLSHNADFIGHAQCAAEGKVRGTAVLLGSDLTDLPAEQISGDAGRIRFPLVATY